MFDAVADTVADMTLQNHLSCPVKGGFGSVDLGQHILSGDVLIHHTVNGLNLTDDFPQSAVQIVGVHTLSHTARLPPFSACFSIVKRAGVFVKRKGRSRLGDGESHSQRRNGGNRRNREDMGGIRGNKGDKIK